MVGRMVWPGSGVSAAREIYGRFSRAPPPPGRSALLSHDEIAEILVTRRERLLRQLPRQIKLARRLTADQREWVVDEATDFLVTQNKGVIADDRRARARLLEGRGPPGAPDVRGPLRAPSAAGCKRVDLDDARRSPTTARRPRTPSFTSSSARRSRSSPPSSRTRSAPSSRSSTPGRRSSGASRSLGCSVASPTRSGAASARSSASSRRSAPSSPPARSATNGTSRSRPSPTGTRRRSTTAERTSHLEHCSPCRVEYHEPGPRDQVRPAAARDRPDPAAAGDRRGRAPPRALGDRRRLVLAAVRPRRRRSPSRSSRPPAERCRLLAGREAR